MTCAQGHLEQLALAQAIYLARRAGDGGEAVTAQYQGINLAFSTRTSRFIPGLDTDTDDSSCKLEIADKDGDQRFQPATPEELDPSPDAGIKPRSLRDGTSHRGVPDPKCCQIPRLEWFVPEHSGGYVSV